MPSFRSQVLQPANDFGLHDSYRDLLNQGVRIFGQHQDDLKPRTLLLCLQSPRQGSENRVRTEVLIFDVDQAFGAIDGINKKLANFLNGFLFPIVRFCLRTAYLNTVRRDRKTTGEVQPGFRLCPWQIQLLTTNKPPALCKQFRQFSGH